jgi:FkbM family methyltransferase
MREAIHHLGSDGNFVTKPLVDIIKKNKLEIHSILDIGTRDLWQSVELHNEFPKSKSYAIEANKDSYDECMKSKPSYVQLFNFAALDYDGETSFYAVKHEDNYGASSIFEPTERVVGVDLFNGLEKTIVPAKRIDTWAKENNIENIDLLWVDVQGSEIPTLKGFGELLDTVKVIATEAETGYLYLPNRKYEPTQYEELKKFLEDKGFIEVSFDQPWPLEVDIIYMRKEYVINNNPDNKK